MSRSINLESLYQIINTRKIYKNKQIMQDFLATLNDYVNEVSKIQIKYDELETFKSLYEKIRFELKPGQKEFFYYGYKNDKVINQEFDLLKFTQDTTLNIELKSKYPEDGKQKLVDTLKRQNHILLNCTKNVINYLYILSDEKLYKFVRKSNEEYELLESEFSSLIQDIPSEYIDYNKLEKISREDLIISPYSDPEKFVKRLYYLNQNQTMIVSKILKNESKSKNVIIGGAGTGKSLLLFDLGNKLINQGKKVILVFCGKLENCSELSRINKFLISDIKTISDNFKQLEEYDVVLFDEFQRIREEQFKNLVNLDVELMVYSVDKNQALHPTEIFLNIEEKLKNDSSVNEYFLGEKIRQNNEMSWFIRKLLNPTDRKSQPANYNKVNVKYFDEEKSAIEYIEYKCEFDFFTVIELTEYRTKISGKKQRKKLLSISKNTHEVIGKEYDNVIVIFDEYISFDEKNANLISNYKESSDYSNYPYDENRCYFEALSRVKNKLEIVIINNIELYKEVLEILNWWKYSSSINNEDLKTENKILREEIKKLKSKLAIEKNYNNQE